MNTLKLSLSCVNALVSGILLGLLGYNINSLEFYFLAIPSVIIFNTYNEVI